MTVRIWDNRGDDDGSIHAMGNGDMIAFGRGADLAQLHGPPYSAPSSLSLTTDCAERLTDTAARIPGAAVWEHTLRLPHRDAPALTYTEYMAADLPAYVRAFECRAEGIRWVIRPATGAAAGAAGAAEGAELVRAGADAWLVIQRPGQRILFYLDTAWHYHWIIPQGACHAAADEAGNLIVTLTPGQGRLIIVGAGEYPAGAVWAESVRDLPPPAPLPYEGRGEFSRRVSPHSPSLKGGDRLPSPSRAGDATLRGGGEVPAALDDAAVLLRTHMARDGGMMCCHAFPLVYLRDSYGAARGMLALGMHAETRRLLAYRRRKFERFGSLRTAEAMGSDMFRHEHENDEVEGPAYAILLARDYLAATGDDETVRGLWPMLAWCWHAQLKHLAGGMLPFNGDETYVAGGFYPRAGLTQGSADSTLAFAAAGAWLPGWAASHGFWTASHAERQAGVAAEARAAYRARFFAGDRVWANAPAYEALRPPPRFRHGVCEGCRDISRTFGWLERSPNGRYLCPTCRAAGDLPAQHPAPMEVHSVSLLPAYVGGGVLSPAEIGAVAARVLEQRRADGHIPSVPGGSGFVGYDPALLLENLTVAGHPAAAQACADMLSLRDRTGVWVEYYAGMAGARPGCSRARTWETGVSAAALARYLQAEETESTG